MTNVRFSAVKAEHMERLEQFIPIVERVHGKNNPEFIEVRKVFNQITEKLQATGNKHLELKKEFKELRTVTNNYEIPRDVCESYEAVYNMLEDLDQAYSAE